MNSFRTFVEQYAKLSEVAWLSIENRVEKKTYKKGELIFRDHSNFQRLYFLERGFLRYSEDFDGAFKTQLLLHSPLGFTSLESAAQNKDSYVQLEAIDESVIWEMPYGAVTEMTKFKGWKALVLQLKAETETFIKEVNDQKATHSPEKRYEILAMDSYELVSKTPHTYLAGYLGITPQELSKIEKDFMAKLAKSA